MGIFPDYNKEGPGVDKNAPKKRGIFLYFELLGRYLWKLIQATMLYTAISLPVLILYHYVFLSVFAMVYGEGAELTTINGSALVATVTLAIFWGTGPVSCGFTAILRGMARDEHVWVTLDFFKKTRESFKKGLVFLIVDIIVLLLSVVNISVYLHQMENESSLYMLPLLIIILGLIIYTFMHFFMYEFEITFENSVKEIYKNSLIMSLASFPMCVVISVIILFLCYLVLGSMPNTVIVIFSFLIWVGAMRFIIDFYSARSLKRRFLNQPREESEN